MENLKHFFADNWRSKLVSLFIAVSIWYLIKSHLDSAVKAPPRARNRNRDHDSYSTDPGSRSG